MKPEDRIKSWIKDTITQAYKLGYMEGRQDGIDKSSYMENLGLLHDKPMETLNEDKITKAIVRELSGTPRKKRK